MIKKKPNINSDNDVMCINMASHSVPATKEEDKGGYVKFGNKNEFFDYLIYLFLNSAKHHALITGKCQYITGNGFELKQENQKTESLALINKFIDAPNIFENLTEQLAKVALDLELFNGIALNPIWNKAGNKIVELYHVDFSKIRSNKNGTEFYYTSQWTDEDGNENTTPEKNQDFKKYTLFNPKAAGKNQLIYFKGHRPGMNIYPLPTYQGALSYIETDIEIASYQLNNIKNGVWANYIVALNNGEPPTKRAKKRIQQQFEDKFTGTEKKKFMLIFSRSNENKPELIPLTPENFDKIFIELNKQVQEEIFVGHKITSPMLFGIKTEGQLGGRNELIEASELFKNIYVNNRQKIIEQIYNDIMEVNGWGRPLNIQHTEPIGFTFSEGELAKIMTDEEKREKAGLPKIEKPQTTQTESTLNAINTLSPLVANNVLNAMSQNEIRALAALPPKEGGDAIPEKPSEQIQMSAHDWTKKEKNILAALASCGTPKSELEIIDGKLIHPKSREELIEMELSLTRQMLATPLEIDLTPLDKKVLDILEKNPSITIEEVATATEKTTKEIQKVVDTLEKSNAISISKGDWKVSPRAKASIRKESGTTTTFSIKYSYEWRPDIPSNERDTAAHPSREFCKELLAMDKMWDREEIERLTAQEEIDVWAMRGGFWNDDGVVHPFCRHIWKQNVVKEKKKI